MEIEVMKHPHYKSRWAIKSRRHADQKNPEKWIWFMGGRAYPTKKSAIKSFEYCFQVEINYRGIQYI
jgi:hypothetical protein